MFKKKILLATLLLGLSSLVYGEMEVDGTGDNFISLGTNISIVNLKNKEKRFYKDRIFSIENANKRIFKSFSKKDTELELEMIPYFNYLIVDKIKNIGGGTTLITSNWNSDYIYGLNIDYLKEEYKENKDNIKGDKVQVNLLWGIKKEEELYFSPYYAVHNYKEKSKKEKFDYLGIEARYKQNFNLDDIEGFHYEFKFNANREKKNKTKKIEGEFSIGYEKVIEVGNLNITPKVIVNYRHNFKDSLKEDYKEVAGAKVHLTMEIKNIELYFENEYRKSLKDNNYENISSFGFKVKL